MIKTVLFFLFISSYCFAESNNLDECLNKRPPENILKERKNFIQKKYIRGLTKPIESFGEYIYTQNEKIEWIILRPFYSKVTVSQNGFLIQSETTNNQTNEKYDNLYFREFGSILLSLHSMMSDNGNIEKLNEKFYVKCNLDFKNQTELEFLPKEDNLKTILKVIKIKLAKNASKIEIIDGHDDLTEISFD